MALHFGLYSLLFVCLNKHTRTSVQKLKLCFKFMFRQILSSNCLQIYGSLWKKRTKGLPVDMCCYLTLHAFKLISPSRSPHPLSTQALCKYIPHFTRSPPTERLFFTPIHCHCNFWEPSLPRSLCVLASMAFC